MSRIAGAKNIKPFEQLEEICTTDSVEIKHLAVAEGGTEISKFLALIKNQTNYLRWIQSRHDELIAAREEINSLKNETKRGPKNHTFTKYSWYAEHSAILEAINGFEVFYKRSLVGLAKAIHVYVNGDKIKGNIDAKVLWNASEISPEELLFEHQLYHDLDNIDKCTDILIGQKRYNKNSQNSPRAPQNRALQAVFQIRHTLSHNHGVVTGSDLSKFKTYGYSAIKGEIIDPSKDNLGHSIVRFLEYEAKEFTAWLLKKTANYLDEQSRSRGLTLDIIIKENLTSALGTCSEIEALNWA